MSKQMQIKAGSRVIHRIHKNHTPRIGTVIERAKNDGYGAGWLVLSDHDGRHYRILDTMGVLRLADKADERWYCLEEKRKRQRANEQSQDMNRTPGQRYSPPAPPIPKAAPKPAIGSATDMMQEEINSAAGGGR